MRLVSTHLEGSCRFFYKLWNDTLKAAFVFLFPDAVTCASETKTPAKTRIRAQFRSQGVLWTFAFGLSAKKPSNIVVSELISIVRSLNEPVSFSQPYLVAWSNLSNTRVGD